MFPLCVPLFSFHPSSFLPSFQLFPILQSLFLCFLNLFPNFSFICNPSSFLPSFKLQPNFFKAIPLSSFFRYLFPIFSLIKFPPFLCFVLSFFSFLPPSFLTSEKTGNRSPMMKQVTSLTAQCRLLQPGKPSYHSVASSCWQFGWATNWMERRRRWRDCEETQFKCPLDETNKCKNWAIKPETQHRSPASTKGVLKVSHLSFRGLNRPITTCLTFSTQRSSVNTTFRCVQVIKL